MDNKDKIAKLIFALGKFSIQPKEFKLIDGLNASERGVFRAMTQIIAEKPGTELFGLSELNSYLNFTRPNLSQTINKLEDKGYVERVVLKDDRRVTYIRLTENGLKTVTDGFNDLFSRLEKISKILGEEDTEKLIDLVLRFCDAYEKTSEVTE
ncbi:MAG: MarR family transcriptional regulator [Ruminiclostridium sp.]|nr:MarR family transcriptional regulator [Ruminiclostridium sp.]